MFLTLGLTALGLAGCKPNSQTEYPAYPVTENNGFIELSHNGVVYRPYGVFSDNSYRGKQIGIREGDPKSKICEVKGHDSSQWIVEYLDEFMGGGDMLYKAVGVTEVPAELEQFKQYDN